MKIKTIGALLLSAHLLVAAQTIPVMESQLIESEVTYLADTYLYLYSFNRLEVTDKDISHFSVYLCPTAGVVNPLSNLKFSIDQNDGIYKFDNIISNDQPVNVWFSFESPNTPTIGSVLIKAGQGVDNSCPII